MRLLLHMCSRIDFYDMYQKIQLHSSLSSSENINARLSGQQSISKILRQHAITSSFIPTPSSLASSSLLLHSLLMNPLSTSILCTSRHAEEPLLLLIITYP